MVTLIFGLAAAAATHLGIRGTDVRTLRRAGLVHDLGRIGVPNTIWDKPRALTAAEWEKVRMHSYYTERMLTRPVALREIGAIASQVHERLDGSGYHRGLTAPGIGLPVRVLAAADTYHAMLEARPHRHPIPPKQAANLLLAEARTGRLDADAVDAVLAAAGHHVQRRPSGPAGLTSREIEVLVQLARGATTRQIARVLGITPKTVGNHIEHIYTKTGLTTRAGAALFAMQHGLLQAMTPPD